MTLLILSTYMDGEEGIAYPSERLLAKKAGSVERTIRRHLGKALELGFLASRIGRKSGQGWRLTYYQAHVPDWLPLSEKEETIIASIESIESIASRITTAPDVPRATSRGTIDVPRNGRTTGHLEQQQPDTGSTNNRTYAPQQPDISDADTRKPKQPDMLITSRGAIVEETSVKPVSEHPDTSHAKQPDNHENKLLSEVVIKSLQSEARAEPATGRVINTRRRKDPEPESIEERERKAIVMLTSFPNATSATLAPYELTAERINELRQQVAVAPPPLAQTAGAA